MSRSSTAALNAVTSSLSGERGRKKWIEGGTETKRGQEGGREGGREREREREQGWI